MAFGLGSLGQTLSHAVAGAGAKATGKPSRPAPKARPPAKPVRLPSPGQALGVGGGSRGVSRPRSSSQGPSRVRQAGLQAARRAGTPPGPSGPTGAYTGPALLARMAHPQGPTLSDRRDAAAYLAQNGPWLTDKPQTVKGLATAYRQQFSNPSTPNRPNPRAAYTPTNLEGAVTPGQALGRVASDVGQTVTGIVPGAVGLAKALGEAGLGHPKPLEALGQNVIDFVKSPEQWAQHPFNAALMAAGGAGAVAKGLGSVARASEADRITLLPSTAGGRALEVRQLPHPNPLVRAAQRYQEGLPAFKGGQVQAKGPKLSTHTLGGGSLGELIQRRFGLPVQGLVKPGEVDLHSASLQLMHRNAGMNARSIAAEAHPGGKNQPGGEPWLVRLAGRGSLRNPNTFERDLVAKRGQWADAQKVLSGDNAKINQINLQNADRALERYRAGKLNVPAIFESARKLGGTRQPDQTVIPGVVTHLDHQQAQLGLRPLQQLTYGAYDRFAIDHLGLVDKSGDLHPAVAQLRQTRRQLGVARQRDVRATAARRGALEHRGLRMAANPPMREARQSVAALQAQEQELRATVQHLRARGVIAADGTRTPRLVDANGRDVPMSEVIQTAHQPEHLGDRMPFYLPEKPAAGGGTGFNPRTRMQRPGTSMVHRTGAAETAGIVNHSFEAVHQHLFDVMQRLTAHMGQNETLNRFGVGNYAGATVKVATERAKQDLAHLRATDPGLAERERVLGPLKPVTIGPKGVVESGAVQPRDLIGSMHEGSPARVTLMHQKILNRIGKWDRLNQPGQLGLLGQKITGTFRGAALFTAPRWPVGSAQERVIRLILAGVAPWNVLGRGRASRSGRVLEQSFLDDLHRSATDPTRFGAQQLAQNMHAGSLLGGFLAHDVRRTATDQRQLDLLRDPASMLFSERPGVKQIVRGWKGWENNVARFVAAAEKNTNRALLGKQALQESRALGRKLGASINESRDYLTRWAKGATVDPNEGTRILRTQLDLAGNWMHNTPTVRWMQQTVSPFGLWWLNSVRLLGKTLPRDNPLAQVAAATLVASLGEQGRKQQAGLAPWAKGQVPLGIPGVGQQMLDLQHYTPLDIAREPGRTAMSMLSFGGTSELYDLARGISPLTGRQMKSSEIPQGLLDFALGNYLPGFRPAEKVAGFTGKGGAETRALQVLTPFPLRNPPGASKARGGGRSKGGGIDYGQPGSGGLDYSQTGSGGIDYGAR